MLSDLYVREGVGADRCQCRIGSLRAKCLASGLILQSLVGRGLPGKGAPEGGVPFFWLWGRTRSGMGPSGHKDLLYGWGG